MSDFLEENKEKIKEYTDILIKLFLESDRSIAIIIPEYINYLIEMGIRSRLTIEEKSKEELFSSFHLLGNFADKIDYIYSIGLIDKETKEDINNLKKIRNYFSHNWNVSTLGEVQEIRDTIKNIRKKDYDTFKAGITKSFDIDVEKYTNNIRFDFELRIVSFFMSFLTDICFNNIKINQVSEKEKLDSAIFVSFIINALPNIFEKRGYKVTLESEKQKI